MAKRKVIEYEEADKGRNRGGLGIGAALVLLVIGAIAALVFSEPLRNKALDLLFGAEEEFQYTPPTEAADNGASAA